MKRIIVYLCLIALILGSCTNPNVEEKTKDHLVENEDYIDLTSKYDGEEFEYNESLWYMNDLKDVPLPDPHVYVENDTYYIVGTSDRDPNVVDCYVTKDFVNYELHKAIYDPVLYDGWEDKSQALIFAPEVYCIDGVYYMYYSAKDSTLVRKCSVVAADNPLGPYQPIVNDNVNGLDYPLLHNEEYFNRGLDATIFTDDDGKMYMYFTVTKATQHIVGVELISPYQADWSTYKELVIPGTVDSVSEEQFLEWELYRDNKVKIAEAPFMIKSNGKYYLTYSVNGAYNKYYNVCYAVSDSPLGNFEKPYQSNGFWSNLLLGYPGTNVKNSTVFNQWTGFASGTGHHCFFNMGDQVMVGYHAHQDRDGNGRYEKRYFAFDYLNFDENGVPFCNGPTNSVQPLPEDLSGYKNIAPFAQVKSENVTNAGAINDNYIVDCYNISGEAEKEVTLGNGYSFIELTFDQVYEIGGIAIYNSAFFEKILLEIEYIDFGNGNVVNYAQFAYDQYVDENKEFVFPNSAFTVEFLNTFEADHVVICVKSDGAAALNEIVVLGK